MPGVNVRYTAGQFGLPNVNGLNDQIGLWCTNNSGQYLAHGDVVVFDATSAFDTHHTTNTSAATLTKASQTLTVGDTTGFASAGNLLVMATPVGGGSAVPIFCTYTAVGSGTTFTGVTAYAASATNGVAAGALITVPPLTPAATPVTTGQNLGFAAAPADGGRFVTLTGLSKDANVAGVVSTDGTAGTATTGQMGSGGGAPVAGSAGAGWVGYTGGALPVIPPGGDVFVVTGGVARVNIGALTVAAAGILATATICGSADDTPGTAGNVLGIAMEAQSAKDTNNTIRCNIKLG